jgi:3-deoxy-D-manno-octulosonic-acid transferase
MIDFFYNIILFFYFLAILPKLIFDIVFKKKYRKSAFYKLGLKTYDFTPKKDDFVVWVHSVSVGETKSAIALIKKIKKQIKNAYIIVSTTTETGNLFAKKNISFADKIIYLPFDFSFLIKRIIEKANCDLAVFVESDLWYNFCKFTKQKKAKLCYVSARMSDNSFSRFSKVPFFSKKLLSHFDYICAQSKAHKRKFLNLGAAKGKIATCGNLKLDQRDAKLTIQELKNQKKKFSIAEKNKVLTIASTHSNEEKLLLNELIPLFKKHSDLKIFLAPRHPDRFLSVEKLLIEKKIPYSKYSDLKNIHLAQVVLIDTIGFLNTCFQFSDLAIVGGSFVKVGGHNILEPIFHNVPAVFGPFMHSQKQIEKLALDSNCAKKLYIFQLSSFVDEYFSDEKIKEKLVANCKKLENNCSGSLDATWSKIFPIIDACR